jgi:hypothetical protein
LTSESNNSPVPSSVSSAGFPPPETPAENDILADLISQSDRAAAWLLEIESDPRRQAALRELAEQSLRAADAILGHEQPALGLPIPGETP